MNTAEIIEAIDQELARLQSARALLLGSQQTTEAKKPGRPKGVKNASTLAKASAASDTPKKRVMSAEGKARIAAAQKARWAKQHAGTGTVAKKSSAKKAAKKAPAKAAKSAPLKTVEA